MTVWIVIGFIIVWLVIERGLRVYGDRKLNHRVDRAFGQILNEQVERGKLRREFRARVHTVRRRVFQISCPTNAGEKR